MAQIIDNGATAKIEDLPVRIVEAIERRVLRRGAKIVLREAKRLVPVADESDLPDDRRPGELLRSLRIRAGRRMAGLQSIELYSKLPYANPIHWGWMKRRIRRDLFFVEAMDKMKTQVTNEFVDAIRFEISKLN